jgi:hypothetical protein
MDKQFMNINHAGQEFLSHAMRQGFLAGTEDYRCWWAMWCGGGPL